MAYFHLQTKTQEFLCLPAICQDLCNYESIPHSTSHILCTTFAQIYLLALKLLKNNTPISLWLKKPWLEDAATEQRRQNISCPVCHTCHHIMPSCQLNQIIFLMCREVGSPNKITQNALQDQNGISVSASSGKFLFQEL